MRNIINRKFEPGQQVCFDNKIYTFLQYCTYAKTDKGELVAKEVALYKNGFIHFIAAEDCELYNDQV